MAFYLLHNYMDFINNKVTLSSNKLIIVQLYLSFYTGTKKITDIKRYFEAFKDIEKNSN